MARPPEWQRIPDEVGYAGVVGLAEGVSYPCGRGDEDAAVEYEGVDGVEQADSECEEHHCVDEFLPFELPVGEYDHGDEEGHESKVETYAAELYGHGLVWCRCYQKDYGEVGEHGEREPFHHFVAPVDYDAYDADEQTYVVGVDGELSGAYVAVSSAEQKQLDEEEIAVWPERVYEKDADQQQRGPEFKREERERQ